MYYVIIYQLCNYVISSLLITIYIIFIFLSLFIFDREREREGERERESVCVSMSGRGAERGDTESEAGSRLRAVSTVPHVGLELTNREIMTWAEVGCLTN